MNTHSPTPFIRLKIVDHTDCTALLALRTNSEVAKFIIRNLNQNLADIEQFIEHVTSDQTKLFYKIELISTGELIGAISLKNIDTEKRYAEVGYELFPQFQRKGIMTMALTEIINRAFSDMNLEELEAYTHRENMNSRRLLEKFHFELVDGKVDDGNLNNVIYRLRKNSDRKIDQ